jgi:hypothetical protein
MDSTPINLGVTPNMPAIRMPDKLEIQQDGSVQVQASTDKVDVKPKKAKKEGFLSYTAKTLLAGTGLGAGVIGGGIAGFGVTAGANAVVNLVGQNFSWASMGSAGMVGGAVGAVLFGACGTIGGWKFAEALIKGGNYMKQLLFTKEPLTEEQTAALETIKTAEDSPKDAQKALKYISKNLASDEKLDAETNLYIGLLNHFGNKNTDEALSAYATIKNTLPPGEQREQSMAELGKFNQSFKTPEESMDALYSVIDNLNAKDSIPAECEAFRAVGEDLKKCTAGHAEITPAVIGEAYKTIKTGFSPEERKGAIEATIGQFGDMKAEPKDVMENLKTIVQNQYKGDDLATETKNFLDTVDKAGGNMETARFAYETTKKNFAPGTRGEALKQFFALAESEKSPKDAAEVLVSLNKSLNKGDNLGDAIKSYGELKTIMGTSGDALAANKMLVSSFEKGKDRDAAQGLMKKLAAAETGAGQSAGNAVADFQFVYTHVSKGEKLTDELDKFAAILATGKSSSAAQKAYLETKFQELYKA